VIFFSFRFSKYSNFDLLRADFATAQNPTLQISSSGDPIKARRQTVTGVTCHQRLGTIFRNKEFEAVLKSCVKIPYF
jgi:hypothetical protein